MRVFIFFLPRCDAAFFYYNKSFFHMFVDEHMFMSIKFKQPTMRLANFFFCKSSDVVEWSCFFLIH